MDATARLQTIASATTAPLFDYLSQHQPSNVGSSQLLGSIKSFQAAVAEEGLTLLKNLRSEFLNGKRGRTPASKYMGKTKAIYEFVRTNLDVRMHGLENLNGFKGGLHSTEGNIGSQITKIYEVR
jgi:phenylalanine ammonia-lyase